eukprot:gnl/MRDRNA2_/MRDRNA2_85477_c0_seq1.p1 gnl/MRDRNA2_/MRDRNA2_85477_c0~~gnl/MRDRNA2_/MRDRNA2_85477_c0_seq1.p1  ORF type:complete len:330 (-),score=49.85 gnl/MRDRNA2_/MRDRNA2_85477_c0_seq1:155-1144(-)
MPMMTTSVFFMLSVAASALRMAEHAPSTCKPVPKDLEWGQLIDGKDAERGPNAFAHSSPNNKFDMKGLLNTLHFAQGEHNVEPLTLEMLEKVHGSGGMKFPYRGGSDQPGHDSLGCLPRLSNCTLKHDVVEGLPNTLVHMTWNAEQTCLQSIKIPKQKAPRKLLQEIVNEYNEKLSQCGSDCGFDAKLSAVADFLRKFAWLHPFRSGNGRIRTMLLQREVKRLGLGCGAMMFNNNRDVYFFNRARYEAKIREGLEMYREAAETNQNPWTIPANRKKHFKTFTVPPEMSAKCVMKNVNGNILTKEIPGLFDSVVPMSDLDESPLQESDLV